MALKKINYKPVVLNYLRDSNITNFQSILSDEEVLTKLLERADNLNQNKGEKQLKEMTDEQLKLDALRAVADVLQSITSEGLFTTEIIRMIYERYGEEALGKEKSQKIIEILSNMFKIVHGANHNIESDMSFSEIPFSIPLELPERVNDNNYKHNSTYGTISKELIQKAYEINQKQNGNGNSSIGVTPLEQSFSDILLKSDNEGQFIDFGRKIHSVDYIVNQKIIKSKPKKKEDIKDPVYVNNVGDNNLLEISKSNPSLSYTLVDSPNLRIGTRNSIELATFFNMLSTIELSKCQPYFNATFILPSIIKNKSGNTYKTASITQFLDGTPLRNDAITNNYRTLEASFIRSLNTRKGEIEQDAVDTNLSAFTMPQTINSFDEYHIGHNENIPFFTNKNFKRSTTVHDYTRPFLTIKSFDIDVAPTQGLMSFKTGRLSIVLHDRTRMTDIAPFIKPDMFGSFGAEIAVEYGWSHMDSGDDNNNTNYIAEFLNKTRTIEKYIITNSSFSMDKNGQINIDLSIAMRGPIDIRTATLISDPPVKASRDKILATINNFNNTISSIEKARIDEKFTSPLIAELNTISGNDSLALKKANLELCTNFVKNFEKNFKRTTYSENSSTYYDLNKNNFNRALDKLASLASVDVLKNTEYFEEFFKNIQFDKLDNKKEKFIFSSLPIKINTNIESSYNNPVWKEISEALKTFYDVYQEIKNLLSIKNNALSKQRSLLNKIISSLDIVDPFYNKEWLKDYHRIVLNKDDVKTSGIDFSGISKNEKEGFVSLGSFLTGLIGTHLINTAKFDEIQVVSYTLNEKCGLMSNLNISSLLLPKKDLQTFLAKLFERGTSITIESLISQVIERFITTRRQICYGLRDFYEVDEAGNTKAIFSKKKLQKNKDISESLKLKTSKKIKNNLTSDQFNDQINLRLSKIYHCLADEKIKPSEYFSVNQERLENVDFLLPKIKLTFDTLTSKRDGFQRTICRISVFDENDNPFGSIHSIMKKIYDEGAINYAAKLNRLRRDYKATGSEKNNKNNNSNKNHLKLSKQEFYKKQGKILDELIKSGVLVKIDDNLYEIRSRGFVGNTVKNSMKDIMPSITYGSQNSIVIDASVSTLNEAKLNTVYLTRADRGGDGEEIATKVNFQKDLPLRILPAQSNITIFGCPFANFAQYIFLDFESGTTIDNAYAITGIKHSLTPGKFTTQLTLSYGDIYGKYENTANTLAREIEDRNRNLNNKKQDSNKRKTTQVYKDFIKTPDFRNLDKHFEREPSFINYNFKINNETSINLQFNTAISTYISDRNIISIDPISKSSTKINLEIRHFLYLLALEENRTTTIDVELNLLNLSAVKNKFKEQISNINVDEMDNDSIVNLSNLNEIKPRKSDNPIFKFENNYLFENSNKFLLDFILEFSYLKLGYIIQNLDKRFRINEFSIGISKKYIKLDDSNETFENENIKERFSNLVKKHIVKDLNSFTADTVEEININELSDDLSERKQQIISYKNEGKYFTPDESKSSKINSIEVNNESIKINYTMYHSSKKTTLELKQNQNNIIKNQVLSDIRDIPMHMRSWENLLIDSNPNLVQKTTTVWSRKEYSHEIKLDKIYNDIVNALNKK